MVIEKHGLMKRKEKGCELLVYILHCEMTSLARYQRSSQS